MGHVIVYLTGCILDKGGYVRFFVKLWVLVKGTQQCGIGLPD